MKNFPFKAFLFGALFAFCLCLLGYWLFFPSGPDIALRMPIPENQPRSVGRNLKNNPNPGTLIPGTGQPSVLPGSWPQFRGPDRTNLVDGSVIAKTWPESGPKVLWKIPAGEGHAGAAIHAGRVYLLDYDKEKQEDAIRCLSLDDGAEIWRYTYYSPLKRNHGMSRTIPAVTDRYVVALGPKGYVHCLNAITGEKDWMIDLVTDYGTTIPDWYAGQCPLIENGRVILAPGGTCLMMAVDLETGQPVWETPNPDNWQMTHSSIMPVVFEGERQYVWCASHGVVGISAETGQLLWKFPDWKIKIANVPSPVDVGGGRIFLTGGYNSGGLMIQLAQERETFRVKTLFRTKATLFGSDQQTPILNKGHLYSVIPGGKPACLSLDGKRNWVQEDYNFGLGPYIILNDYLLILDDDHANPGKLCLFSISSSGLQELAACQLIEGHDAWAPMAFAGGRLILRDATTLICLDLSES